MYSFKCLGYGRDSRYLCYLYKSDERRTKIITEASMFQISGFTGTVVGGKALSHLYYSPLFITEKAYT